MRNQIFSVRFNWRLGPSPIPLTEEMYLKSTFERVEIELP